MSDETVVVTKSRMGGKTLGLAAVAACATERGDNVTLLAPYRLRYLGDHFLTTRCEPVTAEAGIPAGLLDAMRDTLKPHSARRTLKDTRAGLGLAANQVGALVRVILVTLPGETDATTMVNPRIIARSAETKYQPEGCLSIPGFQTNIKRHRTITVEYQDELGGMNTLHCDSLAAQCVQHEIDHLDGKLIVDGLSRQQRRAAERCVEHARA